MNHTEVLALGVPEDRIKDFQEAYNRDLRKTAARESLKCDSEESTRRAIIAMLKLIQRKDTLERILVYINRLYFNEV